MDNFSLQDYLNREDYLNNILKRLSAFTPHELGHLIYKNPLTQQTQQPVQLEPIQLIEPANYLGRLLPQDVSLEKIYRNSLALQPTQLVSPTNYLGQVLPQAVSLGENNQLLKGYNVNSKRKPKPLTSNWDDWYGTSSSVPSNKKGGTLQLDYRDWEKEMYDSYKCGGKTKKKSCGGAMNTKKKACGGMKVKK